MKSWAADHPKARLMNRKRGDILAAAKGAFLTVGYGGTSMESIAKTADVSIMTLYRHAESKDDLFGAVIANACAHDDPAEQAMFAEIMMLPLGEALYQSAWHMQQTLLHADTIALMRVVMAEQARFPQLAELAYRGFIVRLEDVASLMLAELAETRGLPAAQRTRLARAYIDRIVGADMLALLLGLPGPSADEQWRRAGLARDEVLRAMGDLRG